MEIMGLIPQEVMKVVNESLKGKTNKELATEKGIKNDTVTH
jgi:DNA-binding NarL/FixJ family response regulator